jgi:hypothetical protein
LTSPSPELAVVALDRGGALGVGRDGARDCQAKARVVSGIGDLEAELIRCDAEAEKVRTIDRL